MAGRSGTISSAAERLFAATPWHAVGTRYKVLWHTLRSTVFDAFNPFPSPGNGPGSLMVAIGPYGPG